MTPPELSAAAHELQAILFQLQHNTTVIEMALMEEDDAPKLPQARVQGGADSTVRGKTAALNKFQKFIDVGSQG